jgi:hypothetical protein
MHPSTEDLLKVRDGEPMDAAAADLCAKPEHMREVERLHRVRDALRDLPEIVPPAGVWERVVTSELMPSSGERPRLQAAVGAGIAAAVAAAALLLVAGPRESTDTPPAVSIAPIADTPSAPALPLQQSPPLVQPSYASLVEESARLDQVLRNISYQRPVMNASTAGTIVGLEDRIAFIDEQLTYGAARGLGPRQRGALWGERVELMNALVYVRLAQAQRTGF